MRKLIALLLFLPLAASSRMFPTEVPIPAVCWDSFEEAISYHKDILNEYPVGRGFVQNPEGYAFVSISVNNETGKWTFLHFFRYQETNQEVVCAITSGHNWENIIKQGVKKMPI